MACSGFQYLMEAPLQRNEADYIRCASPRWSQLVQYDSVDSTVALEAWDMKYKPNAGGTTLGGQFHNIIPRNM
jgi:hypothetical protein